MPGRNILLITGDHTRHDALACNLDTKQSNCLAQVVRTPNLDRLAREGVTFLNSFTPNPICVPARASITTGNYPHKCTGSKGNGGRIRDDQVKLAEHFGERGYATFAIGKLHYVPYSPPGQPRLLHGFQRCEINEEGRMIRQFDPMGKLTGIEDYHDYLRTVGWGGYERAHGVGNNDVHPSPSPVPAEYHEEAWVVDRTIAHLRAHLERSPERPFLMWSSFTKPHSPYDPPRPWDAMYDPRTTPPPLGGWENEEVLAGRDLELITRRKGYGWDLLPEEAVGVARAYYCGMMSWQDAQIGRLLTWLGESGLADNTIIIYTADHGDLLGDFGRFFKSCFFDGSVKIPFVWRVPGVIPEDDPHSRTQLAGLQDILPTLCSLTDCPLEMEDDRARKIDGQDLTPVLAGPDAPGREYYVAQTGGPPHQKYMVRTAEWKYVYTQWGAIEELYKVGGPDYELVNLAADPECRGVRKHLRRTLIQWCRANGDEDMLANGELASEPVGEIPEPQFRAGGMGWRKY